MKYWFHFLLYLSTSLSYGQARLQGSEVNLEVDLSTTWKKGPFQLELLESISGYNESLYIESVCAIIGHDLNENGEKEEDEEWEEETQDLDKEGESDRAVYERVLNDLGIDEYSRSLIGFNLASRMFSPRIVAHYEYFETMIGPKYGRRLLLECSQDLFGRELPDKGLQAWVLFGDQIYCTAEDLYALKSQKVPVYDVQPFDRIIGQNEEAPFLVLYGDVTSDHFRDMFIVLLESSVQGKLRFTWRYTRGQKESSDVVYLGNHAADLLLGGFNYISDEVREEAAQVEARNLDLQSDLHQIRNERFLNSIRRDDIDDVSLKLTAFVMNNNYTDISKIELLKLLLQDFPKFAYYLHKLNDQENLEETKKNVLLNLDLGISEDSNGIFVNGAQLNALELDMFSLMDKIQTEAERIRRLREIGFSTPQAKFLQSKFALLSSIQQARYLKGNSVLGSNENRFKVFEYQFQGEGSKEGGVVFFNDLEKDLNLEDFEGFQKGDGAAPSMFDGLSDGMPENIFNLIFAINLAHKEQLKVFFAFARNILDKSLPQQIGILPLVETEKDRIIAEKFYFLFKNTSKQEALAFLFKYLEAKSELDEDNAINSIPSYDDVSLLKYNVTSKRFSIDKPSVICNGVIYDLRSTWHISLGRQMMQDFRLIKNALTEKADTRVSLKSILYKNAKSKRNIRIFPLDLRDVKYQAISLDLIRYSTTIKPQHDVAGVSVTFWLIGDCNSTKMISQMISILKLMKKFSEYSIQFRFLNTFKNSATLDSLLAFNMEKLGEYEISRLISLLKGGLPLENSSSLAENSIKLLERNKMPLSHDFMLINSRYVRLDNPLEVNELQELIDFEKTYRLDIINEIITDNEVFNEENICKFNKLDIDCLDWFDLMSSYVTKSFHIDDALFVSDVARFDLSPLNANNSIVIGRPKKEAIVDVLVVIDPIKELSQELVSIVDALSPLHFIQVRIILQPSLQFDEKDSIKRFYRDSFTITPQFDEDGAINTAKSVRFESIPLNKSMTLNQRLPLHWIALVTDCSDELNLDDVKFMDVLEAWHVETQLKNLYIEGFVKDVSIGLPVENCPLMILNEKEKYESRTISSLGYFQLKSNPGTWKFQLQPGVTGNQKYDLLSASENPYDPNKKPLESVEISVLSLKGLEVRPRLTSPKTGFKVSADTPENNLLGNVGSYFKSILKQGSEEEKPNHTIHVFSIASGKLYERLLLIMMKSVMSHTLHPVKFWIFEDYTTPEYRKAAHLLSEKLGFEYESISFKWPNWLRIQRDKHRLIWGYKILFLDVLFPEELERVIFIDADQIVRADLKELKDIDLHGAPYGFVPMCDSKKEVEGYRFWKEGYWRKVLKDDLRYHISALFVVDLKTLRDTGAANMLRTHYQKLSSDPRSLANLDQDLPNNLQRKVPIFSLPQEWLWCDSWCSMSEYSTAKSIDLCNDPLSNESKVQRAKKLIPEWGAYNDYIEEVFQEVASKQITLENSDADTTKKSTSTQKIKSKYNFDLMDEL